MHGQTVAGLATIGRLQPLRRAIFFANQANQQKMQSLFSGTQKPLLLDLTGRVAIVTGANTGIGYFTVLHLARSGAKVYLGARNEAKATAAIANIRAENLGPNPGEIIWFNLDLTYPRKVKEAAEWFLSREQRLDILINNAGKQAKYYALTSDGLSESIVINHLSPFILTNTLLPLMKTTAQLAGADVRIVSLSSVMHAYVKKPFAFNTTEALNSDFKEALSTRGQLYSYTKLANILHIKELQKQLDAEGIPIICTAVHPGVVWTNGAQDFMGTLPFPAFWLWLLRQFCITADVGSYTSIFAAASPLVRTDPEKYKGQYLVPYGKVQLPSPDASNERYASELWKTSEKMLAGLGL